MPKSGSGLFTHNAVVVDDDSMPVLQLKAPGVIQFLAKDGSVEAELAAATILEMLRNAGAIPVGSVLSWAGMLEAIPHNWRLADGEMVSRAEFPTLFNVIGTSWGEGTNPDEFRLPDLRGMFLRGVSHGSGNDPDAAGRAGNAFSSNSGDSVGSIQADATRRPSNAFVTDDPGDHTHGDPTWNGLAGPFEVATVNRGPGGVDYGAQSARTTPGGHHVHRIVGGGDAETRPKNAYVYFIIRVI